MHRPNHYIHPIYKSYIIKNKNIYLKQIDFMHMHKSTTEGKKQQEIIPVQVTVKIGFCFSF